MPDAPERIPACAVVTDTCCDLSPELLGRLGVSCCGSAPTVVELAGLYRALLDGGSASIVSVHARAVAPLARTAALSLGGDAQVIVIDTGLVSAALAFVVERAAFAADCGDPASEVAARAAAIARETVFFVIADSHAPFQGPGGFGDRIAYLRRRALGERHLVRLDGGGRTVLASSTDLADLTGRIAQAFGTRARTAGALCRIEAAGDGAKGLAQLEKPFDTNEYVSHHLATLRPAPALVRYAGPEAIGIAMVPESVYGGHETARFDPSQDI